LSERIATLNISSDLVLDASTITSYLLAEENSQKIYQIIKASIEGGHRILTPELAYKEASNAFLKAHIQRRIISEEDLTKTLNSLFKLPLEPLKQDKELILRASAISLQSRLTIYDALYIACAEREKATLLTSDKKQHTQANEYVSTIII
jgi:predicted nucleic acid-binding protein